jgi:hypothetical protein
MAAIFGFIKRLFSSAKRNWKTILETITLLVIVIGVVQLYIQQQQLDLQRQQIDVERQQVDLERQQAVYTQAQKPKVEFAYRSEISESDQATINQATAQLVEEFYSRVNQDKAMYPDRHYLTIANDTLPMTTTIAPKESSIVIVVRNVGPVTATSVRVSLEMDRPVSSINIEPNEIYNVLQGGINSNNIIIEFDRLVPNQENIITVNSNVSADQEQSDRLVIEKFDYHNVINSASTENQEGVHYINLSKYISKMPIRSVLGGGGGGGETAFWFPEVKYMYGRWPRVDLRVISNEGAGSPLPTFTLLASPSPQP